MIALCVLSLAPSAIAANGARTVEYSQSDIVPIHAKIRFSTLIVLPASEDILDFTTGDKKFWIINGAHNLCYVHPAQAGIRQQRQPDHRQRSRLLFLADVNQQSTESGARSQSILLSPRTVMASPAWVGLFNTCAPPKRKPISRKQIPPAPRLRSSYAKLRPARSRT